MKKQLTITLLLLASSSNHTSFSMEEYTGCYNLLEIKTGWDWLMTRIDNTDYQQIPHGQSKIETYANLIITKTNHFFKKPNYKSMTYLIEIIHHAKSKDNIQPYELGKFIFNIKKQNSPNYLAPLLVARIGKYHETIEKTNTPYLTAIAVSVDKINAREIQKNIQAQRAINCLGFSNTNNESKPEEQHDILAFDLNVLMKLSNFEHLCIAKKLYENNESTEEQEIEIQ